MTLQVVGKQYGRGVNGFLVPIKDIVALERAMERFILNPEELIPGFGLASRRIAEEKNTMCRR